MEGSFDKLRKFAVQDLPTRKERRGMKVQVIPAFFLEKVHCPVGKGKVVEISP